VLSALALTQFIGNTPETTSPSRYVNPNASIVVPDDYSNISLAVANAKSGDIIFVRQGVYIESVTVNKPLTLEGENNETTIVDGNNQGPTFLIQSDNVTITNFKIRNVENGPPPYDSRGRFPGIHLLTSNNCNISGNLVVNCGEGVWIYGGSENQIIGNQFSLNNYGVLAESSTGNTIVGNALLDGWYGIILDSSQSNVLRDNRMSGNVRNFGVEGASINSYSNDIDISNIADDKRVYYLTGKSGLTIDSATYPDLGMLLLVNCKDVTVKNLVLSNNHVGIQLVYTSNSEVTNNTLTDANGGILLQSCSNCRVYNNMVGQNKNFGICLSASNGTLVSGNHLEQTEAESRMVSLIYSNDNTVTQNTLTNQHNNSYPTGIYLESSTNNRVTNNTQIGNAIYGLELKGSSSNLIQNNDFSCAVYGIKLREGSGSNQVIGNRFNTENGWTGVGIAASNYNKVNGNVISNFMVGFEVSNSDYNTVTGNVVSCKSKLYDTFRSNGNNFDGNEFTKLPSAP
jgi:parallel beta-helix repeat protein